MSNQLIKVLLAIGNRNHADVIHQHVAQLGGPSIEIEQADSLESTLQQLGRGGMDVVLLDTALPDAEGLEAIQKITGQHADVPIVVLLPTDDMETVQQALSAGAQEFLCRQKLSGESMVRLLRVAVIRSRARQGTFPAEVLGESENRIRAIMNAAMDCIITMDPDGHILEFNRAAEKTFGYRAEEALGKDMGELFITPDVRQRQQRSFDMYQATGGGSMLGRRVESPAYRKDGTEFVAEIATQPVKMDGGLVFTIFLRDITERKKADDAIRQEVQHRRRIEEALRRERDLLQALMDHLPDFIFAKDATGHFTTVNSVLLKQMGVTTRRAVVGKTDQDFFPPDLAEHFVTDDRQVMQSGEALLNREEMMPDGDGAPRWILTTKVPLRDRSGKVDGLVGISRDITARKKAEQELEEAKEAAEAASTAKSAFLANMSHEIRTPMNAVIGMAELMMETKPSATQAEYIEIIRDSGESLLMLINDILDFSKIEAGKLEFERSPFALRDSLAPTMKSLGTRAHRKSLELACHYSPNVPESLIGDVNRLRQIVINLVGNAIKFTDEGEVVLDVSQQSQTNGDVELHFAVRDTGIDIAEAKVESIFGVFEQADISMTRRFGGTGLGLTISSRLVDMMGGRIWVESAVGQGSTFHFTSRFALGEADDSVPVPPADVTDARVIVVDDNATNRRILEEMLTLLKVKPTVLSRADEAFAALCDAASTSQPFAAVVSDVNMPDVDGFMFAEQIKKHPELASTPVILLTSGDRPGDLGRCAEIGIAAHLLKPVNQSELFNALASALGDQEHRPVVESKRPAPSTAATGPLKILLAEDSKVNQKLAIGLLKKDAHQVTVVETGSAAVEAVSEERFDLVLMDVQMPEMDGLEATKAIREREKESLGRIPIIAMTAHAMAGDRELCLDAGMDDYISKPIRTALLYEKLSAINPQVAIDPPAAELDAAASFDLENSKIAEAARGDKQLMKQIVSAFLDEAPQLLTDMRQALADQEAETLMNAAHTMKGAVRVFDAECAEQLSRDIERLARDEKLEQVAQLISNLAQEVQQMHRCFTEFISQCDTTQDAVESTA